MINRKLIRPNLAELKDRQAARSQQGMGIPPVRDLTGDPMGQPQPPGARRAGRQAPPEQTCAEAFYYLKQMNNKTPMVVVLDNGEQVRGRIEWYDRACIKVNRDDDANLLVYKHAIKYLLKQEEEEQDYQPSDE